MLCSVWWYGCRAVCGVGQHQRGQARHARAGSADTGARRCSVGLVGIGRIAGGLGSPQSEVSRFCVTQAPSPPRHAPSANAVGAFLRGHGDGLMLHTRSRSEGGLPAVMALPAPGSGRLMQILGALATCEPQWPWRSFPDRIPSVCSARWRPHLSRPPHRPPWTRVTHGLRPS